MDESLLEGEINIPGRSTKENDGEFNTLDEPVKDTIVSINILWSHTEVRIIHDRLNPKGILTSINISCNKASSAS